MSVAAFDPTFVLSNQIEAVFWVVIAVAMMVAAARSRGVVRQDCVVAAIAFAVFGVSDFVETTTGGWWRPWWLFAWKAACVLAFLVLLARHARRQRPLNSGGQRSTAERS
jgi:hypothetical protein